MIRLGFEYLWIFLNGKEYSLWCNIFWIFQDALWEQTRGLAMVHRGTFKVAWNPARRTRPRQQLPRRPGVTFPNERTPFFTNIFSRNSAQSHFPFCSCKTKCLWKKKTFWPNRMQAYQGFSVYMLLTDRQWCCQSGWHCTGNRPIHPSVPEPLGHSEIWFKLLWIRTCFRIPIYTWNLCRNWPIRGPGLFLPWGPGGQPRAPKGGLSLGLS